jgi:hypothetical protein
MGSANVRGWKMHVGRCEKRFCSIEADCRAEKMLGMKFRKFGENTPDARWAWGGAVGDLRESASSLLRGNARAPNWRR